MRAMRNQIVPAVARWPFFLGDALLLGAACFVFSQARAQMQIWETVSCIFCVAMGAVLAIFPYVLEYRAATRIVEADAVSTVVERIQKLEQIASQISTATARWQEVHESADKTGRIAGEIAERMAGEIKAFNEFLHRTNEGEKAALRLEVEKLRRGESEWLQVLVRMLDHVYALHQAALRSQQPALIDQLGNFQNACRDVARRVGLAPFIAMRDQSFDAERHQLADGSEKIGADAKIIETIATGYTYQGKLLRPAVVRIATENRADVASVVEEPASAISEQSQLPLESAQ